MNEVIEIWKDIVGWEGFYAVSNLGRVKSYERKVEAYRVDRKLPYIRTFKETILKPKIQYNGYQSVCLQNSQGLEYPLVHRLVAKAFIVNPENKFTVNHIDCNKINNEVSNLEWSTSKEQNEHYASNDRYPKTRPTYTQEFKMEIKNYFLSNNVSIKKLSEIFQVSERTAGRVVNE